MTASAMLREPAKVSESALLDCFAEFKTFDEAPLCAMKAACTRFCCDMASGVTEARWITLAGRSGIGKTMLARGITRFFRRHLDCLRDESQPGRYLRRGGLKQWGAVVGDMLSGDYSGIRDLRDDWFVALDDIGAEYERNKELSTAKLYEILSARERRFTVITANLSLAEIGDKLDNRIASRLLRHGSTVISAPKTIDYNLRK
jgi:DNA replication protein DnaC